MPASVPPVSADDCTTGLCQLQTAFSLNFTVIAHCSCCPTLALRSFLISALRRFRAAGQRQSDARRAAEAVQRFEHVPDRCKSPFIGFNADPWQEGLTGFVRLWRLVAVKSRAADDLRAAADLCGQTPRRPQRGTKLVSSRSGSPACSRIAPSLGECPPSPPLLLLIADACSGCRWWISQR